MSPAILSLLLILTPAGARNETSPVFLAAGALEPQSIIAAEASDGSKDKPTFRPSERAVSNWREESAASLDVFPLGRESPTPDAAAAKIARCVKLNNYWCVKRAGWAGEIAADSEGHVAFGSALEGAIVAAMLLRRYYVEYHRHSAHDILSRWAPANCGAPNPPAIATRARRRSALAPHGIFNTLRARWLAAHRVTVPGGNAAAPAPAPRRSIVPDRFVPLMRAPEIAVGMGESALDKIQLKMAAFDAPHISAATAQGSCPAENQRVRNYALRAIEGVAESPDEDLKLFTPEGAPGANLLRLMENMAKVEIGPLKARFDLITRAVEIEDHRRQRAEANRSATAPETAD